MSSILVTGGAGFIGGEFVRQWISEEPGAVINLDNLTYAGTLDSLESVSRNPRTFLCMGILVIQIVSKPISPTPSIRCHKLCCRKPR